MKLFGILRTAKKVAMMFPEGCETGNELDWMLKGNCAVCVAHPYEQVSVMEYRQKYPALNTLTIGKVKVHLCDQHLEELFDFVEQKRTKG